MKETLKQAGYKYLELKNGLHYLTEISTGNTEVFQSNKYFLGWGLIYKNTHLEFCHTLPK